MTVLVEVVAALRMAYSKSNGYESEDLFDEPKSAEQDDIYALQTSSGGSDLHSTPEDPPRDMIK